MGHKKVGTGWRTVIVYPDGHEVEVVYDAEFVDTIMRGKVESLYGTFAGKFTADAIDAVGNLNITGRAVAATFLGERLGTFGGWDDDAVYRNVIALNAITHPDDKDGGFYIFRCQFRTWDAKGDNAHFKNQFRLLMDGQVHWESSVGTQLQYQYGNRDFSFAFAKAIATPGVHTFQLQYRIFPADTNAYPRFQDVRASVDYMRK